MAAKIKKGDRVMVRSGRDKGRIGEVKACFKNNTAIVMGINLMSEYIQADPKQGIQGGIQEREHPIRCSKLALLAMISNKPVRVGFKFLEDGKKVRYLKSAGKEVIDA